MQESGQTDVQEMASPLHVLTLDTALADLLSGRGIGGPSGIFKLGSVESRSVLDWYRRNRPKWAGNVTAVNVDGIIDSIAVVPLPVSAPANQVSRKPSVLRLQRIEAHRFAGLHAYDDHGAAPARFVFQPECPLTLFEGWNGSGKTSLANAVIWCLTGKILRAQRPPEDGSAEFDCQVARQDTETSDHRITPVTPLPSTGMAPDAGKAIPADTWVELTFVDETGIPLPPVRRTQARTPKGKLIETESGFENLSVDPIALQIGTTIPGMLPFLQVGSASELGTAVAKLTGLADFVHLAKHAERAKARVLGPITRALDTEIQTIEDHYNEAKADLVQRIRDFPDMAPRVPLPAATDNDAQERIAAVKTHFVAVKTFGLAAAKAVLGEGFDAEDSAMRQDLEDTIGPAVEQLKQLGQQPAIRRLAGLKLELSEIKAARACLTAIHDEAAVLAALADDPIQARRLQLYARVAGWMKAHGEECSDACVVCRRPFDGVTDPETGTLVAQHLADIRERAELVSKAAAQWALDWTGSLSRDLPAALVPELQRDLPATPVDLLREGVVDNLFATEAFSGVFASLKPATVDLAARKLQTLPEFSEPTHEELPPAISQAAGKLGTVIRRLERALAFAEWSVTYQEAVRNALGSIRRSQDGEEGNEAVGDKLDRLASIVKGVAPITAAIELTDRLANALSARQLKVDRTVAARKTADALVEIEPIGALAQAQVDGLQAMLYKRSAYWRDQVYRSATVSAPTLSSTGMDASGVIDISVGRGDVRAPAQHIANASALRASLMGFFLAFREHVLKTSGGLSLLVLDDPQDLLDQDNRQRLARALVKLASDGALVLATTHDRAFARTLVQEGRSARLVAHRSVHPVNASRTTLETALAVEDIDRKRTTFLENKDSASDAQDYVNEARIFLEARLGDLFDDPAYPAFSTTTKAPTLTPLVARLRGLVASKANELFRSPVFVKFCDDRALAEGAETRRILNSSHHDKATISYADVSGIDADLRRLRTAIEAVHEEFRRYRWRESSPQVETGSTNVVPLPSITAPRFAVPLCSDIAAFVGQVPSGGSQDQDYEQLEGSWFDDKALFYVRHSTLGFALPAGSVAVVEATGSAVRDHNLVIARHKKQIFARRLLKPRNGEGIALTVEMPDPRNSRPTLRFDEHSIDMHRIVGVLFSNVAPPEGREEATMIESAPELAKVRVAYRVREESAVPLALPGQIVLGGDEIFPRDLNNMGGHLVAVSLDNGACIFKRVGSCLPGPLAHLRQFETIGGLGDSIVIATEQVEDGLAIPVMVSARPVLGVLYT